MKIGIITFHHGNNYGAIMQAYGLQCYLEKLGHEVEFIDYQPREEKHILKKGLRCILSIMQLRGGSWENCRYNHKFRQLLHVGKDRYTTPEQIKKDPPLYDCYITGSDQVWTPQFSGAYLEPAYFLHFVKDASKKKSYAASMGQCEISTQNRLKVKEYLSDFEHISVRETKTKNVLQSILPQKNIFQTIDPALLAGSDVFEAVCAPISESSEQYICAYVLHKFEGEHKRILDYLQQKEGLPIIRVRNPESCILLNGGINRFVSPEQWISYLKDAKIVVCGSFHALAFSLMFHKPFICTHTSNNERESGGDNRMLSLLQPIGLDYRCFSKFDEKSLNICVNTAIDWNLVDKYLEDLRLVSRDFILKF